MSKLIQLTQGRYAIVDDNMCEYLSQWKWLCLHKYAARAIVVNGKQVWIFMHNVVLNTPNGMEGDHISGNTFDNQRSNLRIATRSQNNRNTGKPKTRNGIVTTSQYKGVSWDAHAQKWRATIHINKKPVYLGIFVFEIEAADAYDMAAHEHYGAFARLNFPNRY